MKLNLEFATSAFSFCICTISSVKERSEATFGRKFMHFLLFISFYFLQLMAYQKCQIWWNISNVKITNIYVCELYDHHQYPWEAPQWGTASNIAFAWHLSLIDFKTTIWNNLYRGLSQCDLFKAGWDNPKYPYGIHWGTEHGKQVQFLRAECGEC